MPHSLPWGYLFVIYYFVSQSELAVKRLSSFLIPTGYSHGFIHSESRIIINKTGETGRELLRIITAILRFNPNQNELADLLYKLTRENIGK
jgi:hypothetical protein